MNRAERTRRQLGSGISRQACRTVSPKRREAEEPLVTAVSARSGVVVPPCQRGWTGAGRCGAGAVLPQGWGFHPAREERPHHRAAAVGAGPGCRFGLTFTPEPSHSPTRKGAGRAGCTRVQGAHTGSGSGESRGLRFPQGAVPQIRGGKGEPWLGQNQSIGSGLSDPGAAE